MEDLNTYAEASIPIDQSSSIEIKLFPNLPKCVLLPHPIFSLVKEGEKGL